MIRRPLWSLAVPASVLALGLAAALPRADAQPASSAQPSTAPKPAATGAFKVDGVHSSIVYRIRHNNIANFYGRFNKISGSFLVDAANPSASVMDITIDAGSVDSNSEGRDRHLRSPDFFNTEQFPSINFKATSFESVDADTIKAVGTLTLLGVEKPLTVNIDHTGSGTSRRGGEIAGFESIFTIKRSDFGMPAGGLGDEVQITISCEGAR